MKKNELTPLEPMTADEAFRELTDYLLGSHYYIEDPVSGAQANAIIVDEIKRMYRSYDETHRPLKHMIRDWLYRILS